MRGQVPRQFARTTPEQLRKAAASLERRAAEHREKLRTKSGFGKISDDPVIQARAEAARIRHLQREIELFEEQAEVGRRLADLKEGSA